MNMSEKNSFVSGAVFLVQAASSMIYSLMNCKEKPFLSGMAMLSAGLGCIIGALYIEEGKRILAQNRIINAAQNACCADDPSASSEN